jgi:glycosyltransferase involved in cell wall biosynthesis
MATRLNLGVDAANLPRDRRGMGRYVRSVLHRFATTLSERVKLTLLVPDLLPALARSRYIEDLPGDVGVVQRSAADRLDLDVVWYPWNGMTWMTRVRSVATVHDVWPFVSPAADTRVRAREQTQYREAAARAAAIIAVSEFTKREIIRLLGVDAQRIHVIHQAAAPPIALPAHTSAGSSHGPRERYVLFVGEVEPRKDIATLIEAMRRLPEDVRADTKLLVVGRTRGLSRAIGNGMRLELAGEIADDAQLAALYAGAAALAFPSRYEGFGLPVLEAMTYGTPVVASDAASIPEVGGDAALYFPCGDPDALSAALVRVLGDPQLAASMSAAGKARAQTFDEETRAARTLEVLEDAAQR